MTLSGLFRKFHHPALLPHDPLVVVHEFKTPQSREAVGLLAAVLAYGRVEQIIKSLRKALQLMDGEASEFIRTTSYQEKQKAFGSFKHRFNDGEDMALLLECIREHWAEHGSLESYFLTGYDKKARDIKSALECFSAGFRSKANKLFGRPRTTFEFLFPLPSSGSACKRINLYLRWMVRRKDGIDLGVWKKVSPAKLIIPVDTHVASCSRRLKLTCRKNADWKMAEEITAALRKLAPLDPVKFDFAICSAGKTEFRK